MSIKDMEKIVYNFITKGSDRDGLKRMEFEEAQAIVGMISEIYTSIKHVENMLEDERMSKC